MAKDPEFTPMQPPVSELFRKKTTWIGILAAATAIVQALFGPDDALRPAAEIIRQVMADEKFWLGLAAIMGRNALLKAAGV